MSFQNSEPEVGIEVLMERMKKLVEEGEEETTEEERVKRFEKVENQSVDSKFYKIQDRIMGNLQNSGFYRHDKICRSKTVEMTCEICTCFYRLLSHEGIYHTHI